MKLHGPKKSDYVGGWVGFMVVSAVVILLIVVGSGFFLGKINWNTDHASVGVTLNIIFGLMFSGLACFALFAMLLWGEAKEQAPKCRGCGLEKPFAITYETNGVCRGCLDKALRAQGFFSAEELSKLSPDVKNKLLKRKDEVLSILDGENK